MLFIFLNIRFVATYRCHSRVKVAGDLFEGLCTGGGSDSDFRNVGGASAEMPRGLGTAVGVGVWAHRSIGLDGRMMDGWIRALPRTTFWRNASEANYVRHQRHLGFNLGGKSRVK